jgi:tetratricopeptide (TPR) repeat protein
MKRFLTIFVLAIVSLVLSCSRSPQERAARFVTSGKLLLQKGEYTSAFLQFKNAARLQPRDPEPLYYMGLISITQGRAKEAIAYLKRATEVSPQYVPAQIKLAELMVLSQRPDLRKEAAARARAILEQHPENADALALLASIQSQAGDLENAERELREALDHNPGRLEVSTGLASLELSRGNWSAAESILKRAIAAAPHSPDPVAALGELYLLQHREADARVQFQRALQIDPHHVPTLLHLAQIAIVEGRPQEAEGIYRRLSQQQPGRFGGLLARFLAGSGKLPEAIAEYRMVLKADPDNRRVRSGLVEALIKAGRVGEANSLLKAALDKNPSDVEALQQRAELLFEGGQYESSRQALAQLLQYEPNSAEAHYLLSGIYKVKGQFARQYQELNEALRLNPQLLPARIELARALLRDDKASEALQLLQHAPAEQQQSPLLVAQRNWTFLALRDLRSFASGIPGGAAGNTPEFLLQRGILKLAEKDLAGAESSFGEVLKQSPEEVRALEGLAQTYVRERRPDLALETVRSYAAKEEHATQVQLFAGNWFLRAGHPDEARAAFEAALAADPANREATLALVEMDERAGNFAAAEKRLERLAARDDHDPAAQKMLAELEQAKGNSQAAIEHYRKAVEIAPGDATALNNLAWALANVPGQAEQALAYAQRAKELAPDDPAVDDTLGWILYEKGIYRPALEYVKEAAAKSHNAIAEYHLAILYFRLGDVNLGKQALESAKRMDPNRAEAKLAEQAWTEALAKSHGVGARAGGRSDS